MTNTNDAVVLQLQEKVKIKKLKLAELKKGRHTSTTKCILEWEGKNINFHVVGKDELTFLLVKIHTLYVAADDLLLEDFGDTVVQGHTLDEWILDIKGKIKEKDIAIQEKELKVVEAQLDKMLSEDKKTELKLKELAALLN